MTQGAHLSSVEDLDQLLAARSLRPKPVKLLGIEFEIRRDFTPEEVVEFWRLLSQRKSVDALSMLVGDETALRLDSELAILPIEHIQTVFDRIQRIAGVVKRRPTDDLEEGDTSGESLASSPQS